MNLLKQLRFGGVFGGVIQIQRNTGSRSLVVAGPAAELIRHS
jgi:hypothetical protein